MTDDHLTIPEVDQDLFLKIHDQIQSDPASHFQNNWEWPYSAAECGTRRCVAGWAHFLTTGKDWFRAVEEVDSDLGSKWHPENIAQEALGLTDTEAANLFYGMDDDVARQKVEHYALKGREGIEYIRGGRPIFPFEDSDPQDI